MLIGLGAAVFFGIRACTGERTSRADWWMSAVLAANPVWFGTIVWFFHRKPSDDIIPLAGFVLAHAMPALFFSMRFRVLSGSPKHASDSISRDHTGRVLTLLFLSILIGGWTAGLAGLVYPITDPFMFDLDGDYTVTVHEQMLGGLRFASEIQWLGFVLGFLAGACIVAPLAGNTKLEISVPTIFLPPLMIGVGTTFIGPFLAILCTAMAIIATSAVSRWLFSLSSRRYSASSDNHCLNCGYDFSGLGGRSCPECGPPN